MLPTILIPGRTPAVLRPTVRTGARVWPRHIIPTPALYAATHQGSNAYSSWGQSVVSNGNKSAYTQHYSNANGTVATAQGSQGGAAAGASTSYGNTAAAKTSSGNMYATHDGNVYKNTGSGWSSYDNGNWNSVNASKNAQQQKQSYQNSRRQSGRSPATRPEFTSAPTSRRKVRVPEQAMWTGISRIGAGRISKSKRLTASSGAEEVLSAVAAGDAKGRIRCRNAKHGDEVQAGFTSRVRSDCRRGSSEQPCWPGELGCFAGRRQHPSLMRPAAGP